MKFFLAIHQLRGKVIVASLHARDLLPVFLNDDDERLVGCLIKNFAVLLRKYREQFSLVIQQEGVRLDYFFVALSAISETRHPQEESTYHALVARSNNVLVPVDSEHLCAA